MITPLVTSYKYVRWQTGSGLWHITDGNGHALCQCVIRKPVEYMITSEATHFFGCCKNCLAAYQKAVNAKRYATHKTRRQREIESEMKRWNDAAEGWIP